jgi:hypothetical protein
VYRVENRHRLFSFVGLADAIRRWRYTKLYKSVSWRRFVPDYDSLLAEPFQKLGSECRDKTLKKRRLRLVYRPCHAAWKNFTDNRPILRKARAQACSVQCRVPRRAAVLMPDFKQTDGGRIRGCGGPDLTLFGCAFDHLQAALRPTQIFVGTIDRLKGFLMMAVSWPIMRLGAGGLERSFELGNALKCRPILGFLQPRCDNVGD